VKFVLFVEGASERKSLPEFFKRWLDPKLPAPVRIAPVKAEGWRDFLRKMPRKIGEHVRDQNVIGVIGLLDLSGPEYPPEKRTVAERYPWLVEQMQTKVAAEKFHPFAAVHELEAWLLSDPTIFPPEIRDTLLSKVSSPEGVNFDEPPKKLLTRLYREKLKKSYRATVDTVNLFARLDPAKAYTKCPYLRSLLEKMLELAK